MSAPRLGFIGLGWIGALRMEAVVAAGAGFPAAICDPVTDRLDAAARAHPGATPFDEAAELIRRADDLGLDGVVIATPNALHAPQTLAALDHGLAVFCQKPLAVNAAEARAMVDAARRANRLLEVDYSYRHTEGAHTLREFARNAEIGRIFAIESVFHNAYGPDKAWCHDLAAAGGGALIDLGVHQVDLPLWMLGFPGIRAVEGRVFCQGEPATGGAVDDFALARIEVEGGAVIHVSVSWNAHIGQDCVIRTTLFGTAGGGELRNCDGSFYDFEVALRRGRTEKVLSRESRAWMGRGIIAWARRLSESPGYAPGIESSIRVTEVVDTVYGVDVPIRAAPLARVPAPHSAPP